MELKKKYLHYHLENQNQLVWNQERWEIHSPWYIEAEQQLHRALAQ